MRTPSDRGRETTTFSSNPLQASGSHWGLATRVSRGAGVWAFLLAILTAGALGHVAVRLKGLEVAYDLGRERRIATDLEEQRRRLQIEIGMLKDPRRVVSIARDKLNMGAPNPEAIRHLRSGGLRSGLALATSPAAKDPAPAKKQKDRAPRSGSNANSDESVP